MIVGGKDREKDSDYVDTVSAKTVTVATVK